MKFEKRKLIQLQSYAKMENITLIQYEKWPESFWCVCLTKIACAMNLSFAKIMAFVKDNMVHESFMCVNLCSKLGVVVVRNLLQGLFCPS